MDGIVTWDGSSWLPMRPWCAGDKGKRDSGFDGRAWQIVKAWSSCLNVWLYSLISNW